MPRLGPLPACGQAVHGRPAPSGGFGLCFACDRPGSRDGSNEKWKHIGRGVYWSDLEEWAATADWPHDRDIVHTAFQVGECICGRPDCVSGLFANFKRQKLKAEKGSLSTMAIGQHSPMGRYPSSAFQVRALLEHVEVKGRVLDCCGANGDAVATVLSAHGATLYTNDFDLSVLPLSVQRSFRDGAFRQVADGGVAVTAGLAAVLRPRLAARFLSVGRDRKDYRYGTHPRQVIEVVQPVTGFEGSGERAKLIVFVHGGAWGSGSTWMYRVMVDRLSQMGYTVASLGYRVYPDADTAGQLDDLAAAIRWISDNLGLIGFDVTPELFLMGHSSGAHISLLYLIRRAKEDTGEDRRGAREESDRVGDGGELGQLEVEGFIGLSGVYDVHRHYLYESWRGVHEISPMKAANGGVLHKLFHYSHPLLLAGKPRQPSHWSSRATARPHDSNPPNPPQAADILSQATEHTRASSSVGGVGVAAGAGRKLGRRLPRSLVVHGMADATVPFSQTAAVAAALKALGVPTTVRFEPGGDHFGMVGQIMFTKESDVEVALSQFTSAEAAQRARQHREEGSSLDPRPRL